MREDERPEEQAQLDFDACLFQTARYMEAQRWKLVDALSLATRFWPELQGRGLRGRRAREALETAVWQNYAEVLYDSCRQPHGADQERAWIELGRWLEEKARGRISHAQEREDVVQEALIRLHDAFEKDALRAPRALWTFALQALLGSSADRWRRRAAQKRGEDRAESLEANEERRDGRALRRQPLTAPPGEPSLRPLEDTVIDRDLRRQLEAFFEEHLKSELQLEVAMAYYLEGHTPAEIAALLHKTPHQVRMVKSRLVRALRALPEKETEQLLAILDAAGDEEKDYDANNGAAPHE